MSGTRKCVRNPPVPMHVRVGFPVTRSCHDIQLVFFLCFINGVFGSGGVSKLLSAKLAGGVEWQGAGFALGTCFLVILGRLFRLLVLACELLY